MPPEEGHSQTGRRTREGANLARHLNERYPDAVLFLARYAGGQPEATGAQVAALGDGMLELTVDTGGIQSHVTLELPPGHDEHRDLRSQVRALLQQTRAALPTGSTVPLSSLEAMVAVQPMPQRDRAVRMAAATPGSHRPDPPPVPWNGPPAG